MRSLRVLLAAMTGLLALAMLIAPGAFAAGPTITREAISRPTTSSVMLEADINPQGKATGYHFEYGPGDCASSACASVPVPDGVLAKSEAPVRVKVEVTGLNAGTAYHFRVVAKNADGGIAGPGRTFMTFLAPQQFPDCPNDGLRKHNPAAIQIERSSEALPDCRAYEQATPVDKGGGDASGTAPFVRAALDGGAISFLSVSGVPGGKGSQDFPVYLASRGDAWSTRGLLPPASFGQNARVLAWEPDFSTVYSRATLLGDPFRTTFLAATRADDPTPIVPHTDELVPSFAGSANGGGQVLFEDKKALVAGAVSGKSNLYLWDRASEEISLVDLMNDGQAPLNGAFAGSYDWIRGTNPATLATGGAARDYYLQDQHAFAADGSAIYFTEAGTGQLFVRLNPTAPQSGLDPQGKCTDEAGACTINISASHRPVADPAGARPAAFQGASADGSKSVFTSSEMLTADANTGPEQEPAGIERASRDGLGRSSCALTHGSAVAIDAGHIYWINLDAGAIARAKLDCTDAQSVFIALPEPEPEPGVQLPINTRGLAVGGGKIYWTNAAAKLEQIDGTFKVTEGTVGRATLNGEGAATEVQPNFITAARNPRAVAVDSAHVFWTSDPLPPGEFNPGFIGRAKLDGGEVNAKLVETFNPVREMPGLAVDSGHIYWMQTAVSIPFSMISRAKLDGTGYFEPDAGVNEIEFIPVGEGVGGKGLTVEGNQIYWTGQDSETVGRAKLNGDAPASEVDPSLVSEASHPIGIAAGATQIFWSANGESLPNPGNDLYGYDARTETLSDLAPDSVSVNGADVRGVLGASTDAARVYFAANGVPGGVTGSPNANGETAQAGNCKGILGFVTTSGVCNLYLAEEGEVRFIARLDVSRNESETDATNWAATPKGSFSNIGFQKTSRVSRDGQALLFRSQRQLSDYPNEGVSELYLYQAGENEIHCVSCNPTAAPPAPAGQAGLGSITTPAVGPTPPASVLAHNLSADGQRVFFETTDALSGEDTNGEVDCPLAGSGLQQFRACLDVYEWEKQGVGACVAARAVADGGCLYLLSTGKGKEPALIADASGDGGDVFFFSRARLVGQDEDELTDIYDARRDGGLIAQNPPPPNPCQSVDGCHGPAGEFPQIPPPPAFSGPGNPKSKKPSCAKPKHKVKGRCVTKKHKTKRHRKAGHRAHVKGRTQR